MEIVKNLCEIVQETIEILYRQIFCLKITNGKGIKSTVWLANTVSLYSAQFCLLLLKLVILVYRYIPCIQTVI